MNEYGRNETRESGSFWQKLGHLLGTAIKKSTENYLVVSHDGVTKFRLSNERNQNNERF